MKLYHVPGSRSCRVLWLLEELGLEYTLERRSVLDGSLRTPEYRALNPLGRVPTFEHEGVVFYESGAILQLLLERHGKGRLEPPRDAPERPLYLQWFHWGEATLLPPLAAINANRFILREADRSERALDVAQRQLARILAVLAEAVEGRDFLVGDGDGDDGTRGRFSAADIMVGYGVQLARTVGALDEAPPAVSRWLDGLAERPAFERAFAGGFG